MARKQQTALIWLWLSVAVVVLDQVSKALVLKYTIFAEPIRLLPFLNITLSYNTGAAFSFLGNAGGWQVYLLAAISLAVAMVIIIWLRRVKRSDTCLAIGLSLIIGGALGNLIDRIRLQYVIDFIDFHINTWHYATFNVADAAVCVGAFCIILHMMLSGRRR